MAAPALTQPDSVAPLALGPLALGKFPRGCRTGWQADRQMGRGTTDFIMKEDRNDSTGKPQPDP